MHQRLPVLIANNRAVLGERVNRRGLNLVVGATTGLMFAAAAGLLLTLGQG